MMDASCAIESKLEGINVPSLEAYILKACDLKANEMLKGWDRSTFVIAINKDVNRRSTLLQQQ